MTDRWPDIIIGIVQSVLLYQQNRIMRGERRRAGQTGPVGNWRTVVARYWPMVAMTLLVLLVWGARLLPESDRIPAHVTQFPIGSSYVPQPSPKKEYANEVVDLDGYSYYDCNMHNVTLKYDGRTPINFSGNTISGLVQVRTENHAIGQMLIILKFFGGLSPTVRLFLPPGAGTDVPHETMK